MKKSTNKFKLIAVTGVAVLALAGCSTAATSSVSTSTTSSQVSSTASSATSSSTTTSQVSQDGKVGDLIQIQGLYSWDEAIETAQAVNSGNVVSLEYDTQNNQAVYNIETIDAEGIVTEVEILAMSGTTVKTERDSRKDDDADVIATATITQKEAITTALAQAENSRFKSSELDASWNEPVYKVDIVDGSGNEQEVVINAKTGEVTAVRNEERKTPTATITVSQAEETAKTTASANIVLYTTLEYDDNRSEYTVKLVGTDGTAFEVKIDAESGAVLELERD